MQLCLFLILAIATGELVVDTIGWTDRDLQFLGPALRYLAYDTMRGLHATYKTGYGEIRYNFKPKGENWRWKEGILVNLYPRNLGCLDYNIQNGKAMISTDYLMRGTRYISYFIDTATGKGRFSEETFAYGPQHNLIGAGCYGHPRFAAILNDTLCYYSTVSLFKLGEIGPFSRHNLIAAKVSSRLGYIWTNSNSGELFLRETPNNGGTWYQIKNLSVTVPSSFNRSIFGVSGVYDSIQLHLIADLYNGVNRGTIQLWHYCPYDTPPWHFIYEYAIRDTTKLGRHTAALDRPSIGIDRRREAVNLNRLYIVWEQFDEKNIDPKTDLYRADIWAAHSSDNGRTWTAPIRLTTPDSTSKRFPFLAEIVNDTLHILCFADLIAGSWELGEGEPTLNPVIYLRVPADIFSQPGVSEAFLETPRPMPISPTIISSGNKLPGGIKIYNNLGRRIDPQTFNRGPAGVYFLQLTSSTGIQPIVKVR